MPILQTTRSEEFKAVARERLPDKTYRHTVSVAEFMLSFSGEAGITDEQVAAAGLLHDLCKAMKGDELLAKAAAYGLTPTAVQLEKPTLLHGPVAAEEARRELGVDDPGVYDAIYWHTTGKPGLCATGQALYVADFAEPLRPRPEAAEARRILEEEGFAAALRYVAEAKLAYVKSKPPVDPMTVAFAEWVESQSV